MKRTLYMLCVVTSLSACGTVNNIPYSKTAVTISLENDSITCNLDNSPFLFKVGSLWDSRLTRPYPVLTGQHSMDYDAWCSYKEDKPKYMNTLPKRSYVYWQRMVKSLIKKHAVEFDSLLFTVPGRAIVYTEKYRELKKLKPFPHCAIPGYGNYVDMYRFLDIGYRPSFVEDNPENYIFRTIVKDHSHNILLAIDRIFLKNSDKMLCFMYTCSGKVDYGRNEDRFLFYGGNSTWVIFNPLKNIPLAFLFFYKLCDPISIEALEFIKARSRYNIFE